MPYKLAVIGVGKISLASHIPAALASPLVSLAAFVDPDVKRAKSFADEFGLDIEIAARIGDLKGSVDGALIAAPNHLHAPLAIECLENGLDVLIEKPLASTVAEGRAITEAEQKTGKTVSVGYCTRHYPNYRLFKDLLARQYFGRVHKFAYQFGTPGGWSTFSNYLMDRQTVGGGVLVVTGTHFLDRMLDLFGFPDELSLQDDSLGGPEANARLLMSFGEGETQIQGYAHFSKSAKLRSGMVLDTEKGHVLLADNQTDLTLYPHDSPDIALKLHRTAPGRQRANQFQLQIEDFVHSCRNGQPPAVSARDGLLSLELLEAAYANRRAFAENWFEE